MFVIYDKNKNRIPIKIWANKIEDLGEECLNQAMNLSNLSFAFHHVALMPDTHTGYGMPIGGVLATENVIIPNAVGVDIGCGMCAVKTSLTEINTQLLQVIKREISACIPVGFNHRQRLAKEEEMPDTAILNIEDSDDKYLFYSFDSICEREFEKARYQIGTLGGGNHFIEIQKGSDEHIWIMVHSGSRNLGLQVAKHYNEIAKKLNEKYHSDVPKEWGLSFLPLDSAEGQAYLKEMEYCLKFAKMNREKIMSDIERIFFNNLILDNFDKSKRMINMCMKKIDIHHNYATMENHFGKNVMVHRKGAILARDNIGIIPGSQGSKSYIIQGKSNKDSFCSSSHGAGRAMSRTKAKENLSLENEMKILDEQGVLHDLRSKDKLDEATSSYKDIDVVMKNQDELVKILVELQPLAVIKG